MGMDITTAAYHNSYDVAKKETKRVGDRGSARADNLQDLRDVLAVGKSVERTDIEKAMKKYDPEAYAEYSKLVQGSQNTTSFVSQWTNRMKKAMQDGTIVSGGSKPPTGHREGNATVTISKEAREQQNRTHFSNINDPNDHGFFTKIWDEDGNVIWDASWNNDVEPQKPDHGIPPHGAPKSGQLPHWTEISRDLAEHGFYKNMTDQEIDYLERYLRSMRTADDLNAFADKHTSENLRQYLKDLAKGYENSHPEGIRTASDIMREHSPETADRMDGLVRDFWNTRDKSYLMQASRLALDWLHENYPKHPEWFGGEKSSKIDANVSRSGSHPDERKSFVEIMKERTPNTAKKMQEFVSNFWNTGDKSYLEKASGLALDWLNRNYSKHPEWFISK